MADDFWPIPDKERNVKHSGKLVDLNDGTFAQAVAPMSDWYLKIAQGLVPGHRMYAVPGRKDGVSAVLQDDISQIPGTSVIPDPGGIQCRIVSSSALDTAAGTGSQSVLIYYLDTAGVEQTEIVITNGATPVNTVATDIDRIQWIHTNTVGSLGVTAGNIQLEDTAGATVFEYILAGGNQSLSCRIHVPTDVTGYILGWQASAITKIIDFRLRATVHRFDRALTSGVFLFQDVVVLDDAPSGWIPFNIPLKIPAGGVVKASAISSAAGGNAGAQFDILFIDD